MSDITIDELVVQLKADKKKLKQDLKKTEKDLRKSGHDSAKSFGNSFKATLGTIGIGLALRKIFNVAKQVLQLNFEQVKAEAKVAQALKTTGNAAGFTAGQLGVMASKLQDITGIGDEKILNDVTAQFLTFGNVSGEVFERAQRAALDLATVIGTDVKSQSIQLGKALDDPLRGLSAMSRAGVTFSDTQKQTIKNLVKENKLFDAQKIILTEIENKYGGQAEAIAKAMNGTLQLSAAWGDLGESVGTVLTKIGNSIAKVFGADDLTRLLKDQTRRIKEFFGIVSTSVKETRKSAVKEWVKMYKAFSIEELKAEVRLREKELEKLTSTATFGATVKGVIGYETEQYKKDVIHINDLKVQLDGLKATIKKLKNPIKIIGDDDKETKTKTLTETLKELYETRNKLVDQGANITQKEKEELKSTNNKIEKLEQLKTTLIGLKKEEESKLTSLENKRDELINQEEKLTFAQKVRLGLLNDEIEKLTRITKLRGELTNEITPEDVPGAKGFIMPDSMTPTPEKLEENKTNTKEMINELADYQKDRFNESNEDIFGQSLMLGNNLVNLLGDGFSDAGSTLVKFLKESLSITATIFSLIKTIESITSFGSSSFASLPASFATSLTPRISSGNIGDVISEIGKISTSIKASELNRNLNPTPMVIELTLDGQTISRVLTQANKLTNEEGFKPDVN